MAMTVHVDRDRCLGHARCHDACPEVFQLDAEGFAIPPGQPFQRSRRASAISGRVAPLTASRQRIRRTSPEASSLWWIFAPGPNSGDRRRTLAERLRRPQKLLP